MADAPLERDAGAARQRAAQLIQQGVLARVAPKVVFGGEAGAEDVCDLCGAHIPAGSIQITEEGPATLRFHPRCHLALSEARRDLAAAQR